MRCRYLENLWIHRNYYIIIIDLYIVGKGICTECKDDLFQSKYKQVEEVLYKKGKGGKYVKYRKTIFTMVKAKPKCSECGKAYKKHQFMDYYEYKAIRNQSDGNYDEEYFDNKEFEHDSDTTDSSSDSEVESESESELKAELESLLEEQYNKNVVLVGDSDESDIESELKSLLKEQQEFEQESKHEKGTKEGHHISNNNEECDYYVLYSSGLDVDSESESEHENETDEDKRYNETDEENDIEYISNVYSDSSSESDSEYDSESSDEEDEVVDQENMNNSDAESSSSDEGEYDYEDFIYKKFVHEINRSNSNEKKRKLDDDDSDSELDEDDFIYKRFLHGLYDSKKAKKSKVETNN